MEYNIRPLDKGDPFSLLEDNLLIEILSRIDCTTKQLIQTTSTISKPWEKLWASVPRLIFLDGKDGFDASINIEPFVSFIHNANEHRPNYKLKLFKLHTNYNTEINDNDMFKSRVNRWIHYAISCKVEEVDLQIWDLGYLGGKFTYDDQRFFNSDCITRIKLCWCSFHPPNDAISWVKLKSLCISCGDLDEVILENILSGSPLLETLELNECYGYRKIDIASKSVKKLVFSGYNSLGETEIDDDYINSVKINAPYISYLAIEKELVLRELELLDVSSLVGADLSYSINWSEVFSVNWSEKCHEEIFKGLLKSIDHVKDKITFGDAYTKRLSRLEASSGNIGYVRGKQPARRSA